MQAILTKFIGPTNTKPARIKASCGRGSLTIGYHSADKPGDEHREAATKLCDRFVFEDTMKFGGSKATNPWSRPFVSGELPDGTVAHVFGEVAS